MKTTAQWVASLSNGEIMIEGTGRCKYVKGEPSPWLKLKEYLEETGEHITSLKIQCGGREYILPSSSPRFKGETPKSYNYFRKVGFNVNPPRNETRYICVEAIYEDKRVQLYVDEYEGKTSWVNVVNL
jgi:hypothetical protein